MNAAPLDQSVKLRADDPCPQCKLGFLEPRRHRFDLDGGAPDCSWLACSDCDFQTEPE